MRKWTIAILSVVAVLAILAFVRLPEPKPTAIFKLPDGSEIEVVKVTFGPTHRFRWDNRLRDVLGERLPARLRDRLGVRLAELKRADANSVVLWTRFQGAAGAAGNMMVGWDSRRRGQLVQLGLADDHGVEVDVILKNLLNLPPPSPMVGASLPFATVGSSWIFAWEFDLFPRHSEEFVLNFYSVTGNQRTKLGELRLPNPSAAATDTWQPESLPASKPLEDMIVTLHWAETTASRRDSEFHTSLGLELTRGGTAVTNWMLTHLELETEDGPVLFRARTQSHDPQHGRTITAFTSGLWPDQPWKLRFWFERTANFPTNELWRLNDVPGIVEPPQTRRFGDWSVNLSNDREAFARGEDALPNVWRAASAGLDLVFTGPFDGAWRLNLLDARDDQGRRLTPAEERQARSSDFISWAAPAGAWTFRTYKFSPIPGASSSSFTFAIHRIRSLEFVIQPRSARTLDVSRIPNDPVSVTPKFEMMGISGSR